MKGMTKKILIDGTEYTIRELTVLEIRNWIGSLDAATVDVVDELLIPGCQLSALREITELSQERMDAMPPSSLDRLFEAAKEVNPRFFAMVDRVAAAFRPKPPG